MTTELTSEQFINEIEQLSDKTFNVSSVDGGGIYLSCYGCTLSYDSVTEELSVLKPGSLMEVGICLDIVDSITKDGDTYTLEFNNGLADVEVTVAK